ncbi:M15 family metallopeptidase [Promicromonospora sp. NPDC057138]|uniref:M15 family metallopeptidase n=1 Tax=Promicromonospora sp. NPDC057138 TaxID=3346031 RepID=UPI00363482A4
MTRGDHALVPRRTRRPGVRGAHAMVVEHSPHPLVRRSSFAIAAALTSVALTTTAAVCLAGTGGAGSPGTAAAAQPAAQPSAVVLGPKVRSASEKADAVLTDAAYVTREGDLSAKERKRVRAAAQNLRALVDQARDTGGTAVGIRPIVASRAADRAPLTERTADGATAAGTSATAGTGRTTAGEAASEAASAADATAPTNLAGAAMAITPLSEQGAAVLPILDTPLADSVDESVDAEEADAEGAETTAAPSADRIEKVTTSLQRLITKADRDIVVSVKAGPTPEEIAAAKKAAEERRAARAARSAEREAAARAAKAKAMVEVAKSYGNGQIPASVLCGLSWVSDEQLRCDAAAALEELNGAFRAAFGRNLKVTDGYRSYAEQVSVAASRGGLAAVPGTSNHGLGQAVDLSGGIESFGSAEYGWMVANAGTYGWKHPGWAEPGGSKPEPWHWEYGVSY